ncbi:hypothetical protein BASA83_006656 [Batrachochytrium salamandrivorans]|nr:hypothetical protein BASA83_006656 [Batrachochytrium salamandrivorans]
MQLISFAVFSFLAATACAQIPQSSSVRKGSRSLSNSVKNKVAKVKEDCSKLKSAYDRITRNHEDQEREIQRASLILKLDAAEPLAMINAELKAIMKKPTTTDAEKKKRADLEARKKKLETKHKTGSRSLSRQRLALEASKKTDEAFKQRAENKMIEEGILLDNQDILKHHNSQNPEKSQWEIKGRAHYNVDTLFIQSRVVCGMIKDIFKIEQSAMNSLYQISALISIADPSEKHEVQKSYDDVQSILNLLEVRKTQQEKSCAHVKKLLSQMWRV